jgi:hypothetical protein
MAAPTAPTAANLVGEAFDKCGIASPAAAATTRATDYFLEEVKDDIFNRAMYDGRVRLSSLASSDVQTTTIGISKYSVPSDFDNEITLTFLTGTHTGTATAGANTTITLAADEDAGVGDVEGNYILLTGGTGENGFRQVTDYNTTTKVATVATAWSTNPSTDSTYRIIDRTIELEKENISEFGGVGTVFTKGDPTGYCVISEDGAEYFLLDKPPDASTYGLMTRYYVNIHKIDVSGTFYTALLTNWRSVLTYGIAAKIAESEDDNKYQVLSGKYEGLLKSLFIKELPFDREWAGFTL